MYSNDVKKGLSSIYQRIKNNCCEDWRANPRVFCEWYEKRFYDQQGRCEYCHLPGNTKQHYGQWFRGGRRGQRLEVDRIDGTKPYSPENCVLACYPCNNAKSDVFSYAEFLEIGKVINKIKNQTI